VFSGIDLALGPGKHGLTGPNGGGKSTLLSVIAGDAVPSAGTVAVQGEIGRVPQRLAADPAASVAQLLGVAAPLGALRRIEAGSTAVADYDAVGEDWDVEERVTAELGRLGLDRIALDRRVGSLSGGEAVALACAAQLLRRPGILLLDEPTNNLDARSRTRLIDGIVGFRGVLVVATHDVALLDRMDRIGELRGGRLVWWPAPFAAFEEAKRVEREAAERRVAQARSQVMAQQRDLAESQTKQARRDAKGRTRADSMPKALAHKFRDNAETTGARTRGIHEARLEDARDELAQARDAVTAPPKFRLELPETAVPKGRMVLELDHVRPAHTALDVSLLVKGPERIALTGPNGIGKTSLVKCVSGEAQPSSGRVHLYVPARELPQDLALLDDSLTVLENMAAAPAKTSARTPAELRERLACLGFRGDRVDQRVATLSGGERWRATLAALLLRGAPPQLLILDEPTNNLDLDSRSFLIEALAAYQGALIVISHDERFLEAAGLTRRLDLGPSQDR
jgi:ATPase subunit of ABC transporter with duplicated ATPase domains